jgi:hypothetical protein
VVDAAAWRQQALEAPPADQLPALEAGPGLEGAVDLEDRPVEGGGQVPAGGVLEEVLGTLGE